MPSVLINPKAPAGASLNCAYPWSPDQGDGTFRNPVICADYSDPDVIRVGNDFYLTASSFNCTPGLPILHSRDLVNWTIIGHAVKNLPHPRYTEVQHGCGVWAPAIRFHAGKFWIFFPTPDEGIYVIASDSPTGPWSKPHLILAGTGLIDPCPLWDDDGKAYLVHAYSKSRAKIRDRLHVRPMAPDGSALLDEGKVVFHQPERHPTIEGPKFLKKDGWYDILAPAGGVPTGWQTVLRSKNIFGPYEDKIVLEQGDTPINGPHQGALVDLPNGDWWFCHFQDADAYGRIVHLQPVTWKDGWPLMGRCNERTGVGNPVCQSTKPAIGSNVPPAIPRTSDEFDSPQLGLQWQWHANHHDNWCSLTARPGWLRLFPQSVPSSDLSKAPNLLTQKLPARFFAVETVLEFSPAAPGDEAGLVITGRSCASLAIRRDAKNHHVIFRNSGHDHSLVSTSEHRFKLRVQVEDGGLCRFVYAIGDGNWIPVPETFQSQPGVWIGAKVGLYNLQPGEARGGHADFDHFRFSASPR